MLISLKRGIKKNINTLDTYNRYIPSLEMKVCKKNKIKLKINK